MDYEKIVRRSLPYMRMLTNAMIDEETAEVLLENAELEIIVDIQAVMINGMEAIAQGRETSYEMPEAVYQACRRKQPEFDDREEEIQYLLQPDYKAHLQFGMRTLSLV